MSTSAPLLGEPLPVELMNTIWADRDGLHDALRDTDGTRAWLRAVSDRADLPSPSELDALAAADLAHLGDRLVDLRNALRRLAAEVTVDPRPAAASDTRELDAAVALLRQAAAETPRWSARSWAPDQAPSRRIRTGGQPASAALSAIAEESIHLFGQDGRERLRACLAPGCVLYFVKDHPRREWCSASCGNRARAARHYQRHRRAAD